MRTNSFFAICSRATVCFGLKNTRRRGDFAGRLPDDVTGLRVPKLQPQPQRRHPVPEQLYTSRLKLIEYLFVELCKPWQQHVSRAKSRSNPSQRLPIQHPVPRETCAQISVLRCQSLIRKPVQGLRVGISRIGGVTSASAPLSAWDRVGLKPWRLAGATNASTTTGVRARSLVSNDGGFGVEVAYVSERYGGPQPASSITTVANNAPPIRPITELRFPHLIKTRAPTSWSVIFSSTLWGCHGYPRAADFVRNRLWGQKRCRGLNPDATSPERSRPVVTMTMWQADNLP